MSSWGTYHEAGEMVEFASGRGGNSCLLVGFMFNLNPIHLLIMAKWVDPF